MKIKLKWGRKKVMKKKKTQVGKKLRRQSKKERKKINWIYIIVTHIKKINIKKWIF